ncbi:MULTISPECIES: hypothetical protein [unclassified Undibacterium]|nr:MULTISPECIES: hypothetical protein [unclassified Undibacterium]MEB0216274.1 hypothetical protein [Undibacterium sp. 5I2]WPX44178.1 hypothetical protein RHM61_02800 [Undibacterium sp. CCC3.4]
MKLISTLSLLALLCAHPALQAAETSVCQSLCTAERNSCRKQADSNSSADVSGLLKQNAPNPSQASGHDMNAYQNTAQQRSSEVQKLRSEKYQSCDNIAASCARNCTGSKRGD